MYSEGRRRWPAPPSPGLPLSVESLLAEIAQRQCIAPADDTAKQRLLCLGEEGALRLLEKISRYRIRNLSKYISFMTKTEGTGFQISPPYTTSSPLIRTSEVRAPAQSYDNGNESDISWSVCRDSVLCSSPPSSVVDGAQSDCSSVVSPFEEVRSVDEVVRGVANVGISDGNLCTIIHEGRLTSMDANWEDAINIESSASKELDWPSSIDHLEALGELDFTKAFLVLSYAESQRLEDVLSVKDIQELHDLSMENVELKLYQAMKSKIGSHFERKRLDWKSNKTREYHCHVDRHGNCTFKGPFLENRRNHMQRVLGDDKILQVYFAEERNPEQLSQTSGGQLESSQEEQKGGNKPNPEERQRYHKLAKEGIFVGLRRYQFFVFKDGGKEAKKKNSTLSSVRCYFVCTGSCAKSDTGSSYVLFNKSIYDARCLFMHVHTVPTFKKYMPRFSLILSQTKKFEGNLSDVNIELLSDIPCRDENQNEVYDVSGEPLIHTEGTGFISEDLASQCPKNIFKGKHLKDGHFQGCPLLLQCRLFYNGCAIKGTFLINKKLDPRTICVRPSMIKVKEDKDLVGYKTINSLEICGTSYKSTKSSLSRYLIALLNYGGIPKEFFIELVKRALDDIQSVFRHRCAALKAVLKHQAVDEDNVEVRMILCGIPLDEPFLEHQFRIFMRHEMNKFKEGKVPLEDCYYLMGTADPTGELKPDQVCVILDYGQVSGKVLVYKQPGLHFGDIHVFNAIYNKDLETYVGGSKFAIFFSTQGRRSVVDEIANSDFDGDLYWVSMNAKLLEHFQPSEPWTKPVQEVGLSQPKPTDFSFEELEEHLFDEFLDLRFSPSYAISVAADSWLVFMDRLLTLRNGCPKEHEEKKVLREKMLTLINIYYEALDAPKTGRKVEVPKHLRPQKKPHFMNKNPKVTDTTHSYNSASILGDIYDLVTSSYDSKSSKDIGTIPCFQDENVKEHKTLWEQYYREYRQEMHKAVSMSDSSRDSHAKAVLQKYKQILYGAASLAESTKPRPQILKEACAIYQVVYEYAQQVNKVARCCFAWHVAGEALCVLYAHKQQKQPIVCVPSVLYEIFR